MMKNFRIGVRTLALLLALLLLAGCGAAPAPKTELDESPAPTVQEDEAVVSEKEVSSVVRVSTVDEFLAAIAPGAIIELAAGTYDLSTASNYGKRSNSGCYGWVDCMDGFTLEIRHVDDLTILGAGVDQVTIAAVPRFANVLQFYACRNLTVAELTAGHTNGAGTCCGGVLDFRRCENCTVRRCGLFGCGTVGVNATESSGLLVEETEIYECSYNAVVLFDCRDVAVTNCEVDHCGFKESRGESLFRASGCSDVTITGCRVHDNAAQLLLYCNNGKNILFLSNEARYNQLEGAFSLQQRGVIVDGCVFENNGSLNWYLGGVCAFNAEGRALDAAALTAMRYREIDPDTISLDAASLSDAGAGQEEEITAATVDEFLAAIGPNRTIVLTGSFYDLSTASSYGYSGGLYYWWRDCYDGLCLVIDGVDGLTIKAASDDAKATVISAEPRYADVMEFSNCDGLTLSGFTAGHTKEPGACAGGVLRFENCSGVTVERCRLYGCGILGIECADCSDFEVRDTEIFECSQGAVELGYSSGFRFVGCDIHDVPSPALRLTACSEVSWEGIALNGNTLYDLINDSPTIPAVG